MNIKKLGMVIAVVVALVGSGRSYADTASREFIMSCTYGVLAGTLVGAAMLAFTDQPGENLSKVARGASLGLYTGILLGLYVVYGVSDEPEEPDLMNGPAEEAWRAPVLKGPRWALAPSLTETGTLSGAQVVGEIYSF